MTFRRILIFLMLPLLLLAGCVPASESAYPETEIPSSAAAETETQSPETLPEETQPEETAAPTGPPHSGLYIPGLTAEDVVRYFGEVCLDAEVVNGGDASLLQKWTCPIRYALLGEYTPEDRAVLEEFFQWFNALEGFPGIREADDPAEANLRIHFCAQEEIPPLMGDWAVGLDGAVTFWYTENQIYDAVICVRSDVSQTLRNSVILEEVYNSLGPAQDTTLRPDSIIFADYAEPQRLTETDELILALLYHPEMECGMDAAACEEIIRRLYY